MSFDIFLQKFEGGQSAAANREAVRAVLSGVLCKGPDKFGYYIVTVSDGARVELSGGGLDGADVFKGCSFSIRGMSPYIVKLILEVARAGDMVILPAMNDFVPILTAPGQLQHLPAELAQNSRPPVLCESTADLELLLSDGYEGWRKYRDQILKGKGGP